MTRSFPSTHREMSANEKERWWRNGINMKKEKHKYDTNTAQIDGIMFPQNELLKFKTFVPGL